MQLSSNYMQDNNKLPSADITLRSVQLEPNAPSLYNEDGTLNWSNPTTNPISILKRIYKARTNNLINNLNLSYKLFKGFDILANLGHTSMQVSEVSTTPIISYNPATSNVVGKSSFTNSNIRSWIIEPQISYQLNIGKGRLNLLMGTTFQQNFAEGYIVDVTGYTSDNLLENIQAGITSSIRNPTEYRI